MRLAHISLLASTALVPIMAKADSLNIYSVQATLNTEPGSSVSGTVTLASTIGVITAEDLTYATTDDGTFYFDQVNPVQGQSTQGGGTFTYAYFQDATAASYFELNTPTLIGYAGGDLCTIAATCPGPNASNIFEPNGNTPNYLSGSITATVTPEPSSFALLGTGMLGLAGVVRKRFS